jgi:hypothetical protein
MKETVSISSKQEEQQKHSLAKSLHTVLQNVFVEGISPGPNTSA